VEIRSPKVRSLQTSSLQNRSQQIPVAGPAALASPGFRFPVPSERHLLERLTLLDLEGAARPLAEIARSLERAGRSELRPASLYAFELLCNINRLVWRGAAEEVRRMDNRTALIEAFSGISGAAELRAVFQERFARIVAPFQGGPSGRHPAIARAKAFVHESYHLKISLREVAAHLGLSRTYLSSLFRRESGFTLTEYIHRVRLHSARELMRSGVPALSTVAARVGYQNYRDFHRNFVRYQNASPKKFKRDLEQSAGLEPSAPARR